MNRKSQKAMFAKKYLIMPTNNHDTILCKNWNEVSKVMSKPSDEERVVKEITSFDYMDLKQGGRVEFSKGGA